MARLLLLLPALAFATIGSAMSSARPRQSTQSLRTIVIYKGIVDAKSAERLTNLIAANTDKVIGLKLSIEKSADSDPRYYVSLSDDQLNITSGDAMDSPVEVLIHGGLGTTTAGAFYTADGFYLIKSGGSHAAGALSYGATSVNEATIRLNPRVRLISRGF